MPDSSLSDIERVKKMSQAERWAWLACELAAIRLRLGTGDKTLDTLEDDVKALEISRARSRWIVPVVSFLITALALLGFWLLRNQIGG